MGVNCVEKFGRRSMKDDVVFGGCGHKRKDVI
jgi:hypothetical protein